MREKYFNYKGLSLVEVVIASLIVSVLLAGLYAVFINAKNLVVLSLHKMEAMVWAQSMLEAEASGLAQAELPNPADGNSLNDDAVRSGNGVCNPGAINAVITAHHAVVTWTE